MRLIGYNKVLFLCLICSFTFADCFAQKDTITRSLSLKEYGQAKTFSIKDLDKDTYVKFDNAYILDRYEGKKPYFITGDDGLRKRVDLYKLIAKEGLQEIGVMIFYTNEHGKQYKAVLPGYGAVPEVWEQYFEDIHAIDKEEKNFVLKLSYVLSKELGFQLYKAQGKQVKEADGTYGTDICFPGDVDVAMADGSTRKLDAIKPGDLVMTGTADKREPAITRVKSLTTHEAKNYAITELIVIKIITVDGANGHEVAIHSRLLRATPNHPVSTSKGTKKIGNVEEGEQILCLNEFTNTYEDFMVWHKREFAAGTQKVYNIVAESGETFIMNSIMVLQKAPAQ